MLTSLLFRITHLNMNLLIHHHVAYLICFALRLNYISFLYLKGCTNRPPLPISFLTVP